MLLEPSPAALPPPRCEMVIEEDVEFIEEDAECEQDVLLAEMVKLQSMLAQLQVERQSLSTALSERVQEEANRARKMTRVLQKGKRSSDDEPQLGARKAPIGGGSAAANDPVYRSSDLGMGAQRCGALADAELDHIVAETCDMTYDDHDQPNPTYRSCSNDALDGYDDAEYVDGQQWESAVCDGLVEADVMSATARGMLDTSLDPSQVDLHALRDLIARLGTLIDQGVAVQEEELSAALLQMSQLNVLQSTSE
jgi:hypothetical protein